MLSMLIESFWLRKNRREVNKIGFFIIMINSLSVLMMCIVIAVIWKRRSDTAATQLLNLSLLMLVWAIGSFMEIAVGGMEQKILWRNITQIGTFGAPAAALLFAIAYTGIFKKYEKPLSVVIYTFQAAAILFIFTDQWHHLARAGISIVSGNSFETLVVTTTALTKLLISFNFIYLLVSLVLFIVSLFFTPVKHIKKQVLCIIAGFVICFVYSMAKVASNEMFGIRIPISGVFALADLCMLFGIFRYDLLMLAPVARSEVFNIVGDGIIIASANGKIVDFNRAAMKIFHIVLQENRNAMFDCVEKDIANSFSNWHDAMIHSKASQFDISIEKGGSLKYYFCEIYPVNNKQKNIGSISVIRDITEQKKNIDLLKIQAQKDGLTGIDNRKTFIERAEKIIDGYDGDVCLLFMDIDYFKKINDNYGHVFGDYVLIKLCELLRMNLSDDALFGRMGGEEFTVFKKVTDEKQALLFAEELRTCISQNQFSFNDHPVYITISIGVAFGRFTSFDALYQVADTNLNKAKESGRNCIRI